MRFWAPKKASPLLKRLSENVWGIVRVKFKERKKSAHTLFSPFLILESIYSPGVFEMLRKRRRK